MITKIHTVRFARAPDGLEAIVAECAGPRRGVNPRALALLVEAMLPGAAVARGTHGRPVVRGARGLHVSFSHTAGATAMAVAPFPVGIDIERSDPELDPLTIDPELFGGADYAALARTEPRLRRAAFYRLWTLKEAKLKRLGRTLASDPLPAILGADAGQDPLFGDGFIGEDMSTAALTCGGARLCLAVCWAPDCQSARPPLRQASSSDGGRSPIGPSASESRSNSAGLCI